MEKEIVVAYVRQGWLASTLSDLQTFGIMVGSFAINTLYLGNNNWLNFCLTLALIVWIAGKAMMASKQGGAVKMLNTSDIDEAIAFLEANRDTVE